MLTGGSFPGGWTSSGTGFFVRPAPLGHSTIRLTADLYGHMMPGDADRAAEAIDRALGA